MKTTLLTLLTLTILLIATAAILAQPPGLPATPSQAPIDGGLSILAALGGGYAIKKLRDKNKKEI